MSMECYVNAVAQVSCHKPLSEEWMDAPCIMETDYVRAVEPNAKQYISPGEARRMSKILARAVCTSFNALEKAQVKNPDAIITGTGKGCMENSEKFLQDLSSYGESCLKPSLFMQSTHNTISSQIAILLKCHGYNNTYSHKGISFESALFDAWIQIKTGNFRNALIGSHDEVTPLMSKIIRCNHPDYGFISESSVSAVLSNEKSNLNICEVSDVKIFHRPKLELLSDVLRNDQASVIVLGLNGNPLNDTPYYELLKSIQYQGVVLQYKKIFGDNFSAPAIGFYVGVKLIETQRVPSILYFNDSPLCDQSIDNITIINHSEATDWTVIQIKRSI